MGFSHKLTAAFNKQCNKKKNKEIEKAKIKNCSRRFESAYAPHFPTPTSTLLQLRTKQKMQWDLSVDLTKLEACTCGRKITPSPKKEGNRKRMYETLFFLKKKDKG